jgi:trimethylamine--corrinoid protein Co-methyltransferase
MKLDSKLRLRVLNVDDSRQIHQATLRILNGIGILVTDEDTRKRLKNHGCREGNDGYILFNKEVIRHALATVPPRMILYNRNNEIAIDTDAALPQFTSGVNCINILDYKTGVHRPCILEDVRKSTRVCDRLKHIDLVGSLGTPHDIPVQEEALITVQTMLELTVKPVMFTAHDNAESNEIWTYCADIAGGLELLAEKPFALELNGPISPLTMDKELCQRLQYAARRSLPVVCFPGLMPGATGPVTLAGALAQSFAETLACIVLHQLEAPGAPIMSGSTVLPMDMHTGSLAYAGPEYSLTCLAAADYFEDIGIPSWVGAGHSDAHIVDSRAAGELGLNILAAVLAGTPLIHNLGYLSSGKTASLEMLVLGDELAGMASRIATGVEVDQETLALDVIKRSAKTESFLADDHTLRHVRSAAWIPSLWSRIDLTSWLDTGAPSIQSRIHEKLKELLDQ